MKNIYLNSIANKLKFTSVVLLVLIGISNNATAQVKKAFTQRTSQYTPTKKVYNVKGDFTMLGNTCLTPQNYTATTNNNGQFMTYVDTDGDANTFNSSSSTLVLSTENGAVPNCSNIVYAGLYWTGKSSPNTTFNVTKSVPNGTQAVNNNLNVINNQNIANTNYALSVTRGGNTNNRYPVYTFSGNGFTYAFRFYNSSATNRVTLSINNGTEVNVPATINGTGTEALLTTPFAISDGTVVLTIKKLIRDAGTNLNSTDTQAFSNADVNVTGTAITFSNVTKTFNKRIVSLKGPASSSYTQITAAATDIYYPSGTEDDIYSAYAEITDYVRTNGIGQYTVADMALLEGDPGGTGYSGGWGIIVVYENSKMKYRDVTIFDGYAYVASTNTSGFDLPVSGFNTVQTGNVGLKLGFMASEGDVSFTGDYFRIRNLNSATYSDLSHTGNSATNFFNSSINAGGTRIPNLVNNTGIDIAMFTVPNPNNTVIGNSQTSTNFKYGTTSDTYSIFTIAMSVDAYIPEPEGVITATTINNQVAVQPYTVQPGQEIEYKIQIKNKGTEAVNNAKITVPIPYNASFVAGSASKNVFFTPLPTPNTLAYEPTTGANGSIVWNIGTLPLPANSDTVLGELIFKIKVTEDCTLLKNANCNNALSVNGILSGTGAITNIAFDNKPLIQGYTASGACDGTVIPAPLNATINAADYVNTHCQGTPPITAFTFCNSDTTIPITSVSGAFPPGSLFYNQFPVVTGTTIQYSIANPFPGAPGSYTYYAVPPGSSDGCYFQFTITVTSITTLPTTTDVTYCVGATALPLTAVPSSPGLTLYYYNSLTGTAQTSITPSTATAGETTYYVAEGQSSTCIGPKKSIKVTVYPSPSFNAPSASTIQGCSTNAITGLAYNEQSTAITLAQFLSAGGSFPNNAAIGTYTIAYSDTKSGTCPVIVTRTFSITTNCGIINSSQSITVQDTTAPAWSTVAGALNATVECSNAAALATAQAAFPVATDACDTDVTNIVKTSGAFVATSGCANAGTYTNTWTVADSCGNTSAVYTQVITVQDTTAPTWSTQVGALNATVECSDDAALATAQAASPVAFDACDTDVTNVVKTSGAFVAASGCANAGTYTNTWTVADACGNTSAVYTQVITVQDTTAPTWSTLAGALNTTVECSDATALATAQALSPQAAEGCGTVTYTKTTGNFVTGACPSTGTYTNTWTATDACGNVSTVYTQVITVQDTTNPTWITLAGSLDVSVECSNASGLASAQALAPQANDNCSNVTYIKTTGTFVAGTCPSSGTYTNTWRAVDACGNTSGLYTQVITVQDTTAPVMTSTLTNPSVTCDNIPTAPTPTFSDNCTAESNLIITTTETQSATVNSQYTITRTWTAEDACGNISQTYTQTVTVTITTQTVNTINVARVCNNGSIETTLDLNTVVLPSGTPAGGTWINESNVGTFNGTVFDAEGVLDGTYIFSYNYNQSTCPQKVNVVVPVQLCIVEGCDNIIVHNAFTPNGDGINENFQIDYINQQCHLPNTVEIYNRWGVLVYEGKNYDNESVVFTGLSNGRATVSKSDELPAGTYFYILQYTDSSGKVVTESKYLYLTR